MPPRITQHTRDTRVCVCVCVLRLKHIRKPTFENGSLGRDSARDVLKSFVIAGKVGTHNQHSLTKRAKTSRNDDLEHSLSRIFDTCVSAKLCYREPSVTSVLAVTRGGNANLLRLRIVLDRYVILSGNFAAVNFVSYLPGGDRSREDCRARGRGDDVIVSPIIYRLLSLRFVTSRYASVSCTKSINRAPDVSASSYADCEFFTNSIILSRHSLAHP